MKFRKRFLYILAVLCLCGCTSSGIRFGAGSPGGLYYNFAGALAEHTGLRIVIKETAGSTANIRLLKGNFIQMAVVQGDTAAEGYTDDSPFCAAAGLYTEYIHIITNDPSLKSVSDLQGKTISVGEAESGTAVTAAKILSVYGLSERLCHTVNLNYAQAKEALQNHEIDAMFITAGRNSEVADSLFAGGSCYLISFDEERVKMFCSSYPFYTKEILPADTYGGQTEDVMTVGVMAVLAVHNSLPDETVKQITADLYAHEEEIRKAVPGLNLSHEHLPIPLAKGAEAYYGGQ